MLSVALCALSLLAPPKDEEVWRWRYDLLGQPVEIYDLYRKGEKVGTGLRRIVERHNYYQPKLEKKYEAMLKPEWEQIFVAKNKMIFARKKGEWSKPLYLIPCERKGAGFKLDKPVQTPWIGIIGNYMDYETGGMTVEHLSQANRPGLLLGKRSYANTNEGFSEEMRRKLQLPYQSTQTFTWDMLDEDFNIRFTMNNIRGYPRRYGKVWRVDYDRASISPLTSFLNDEGEPVSPNIELIKEFKAPGDVSVYAIPTTLEFKRYLPILPDGTLKPEPLPTAGYYPSAALHTKEDVFIGMMQCWTKEYITPDGSRFGWASHDLSNESGPLWRSIVWWTHGYNPVSPNDVQLLAQMSDGTWMIYSPGPYATTTTIPHKPWLPQSYPTKQEAIVEFKKIYIKEVAEPALAKAREEWKAQQARMVEYEKYLGIDDSMDSGGVSRGDLHHLLYGVVGFLNTRLYNDFDKEWPKLPGDYYLKYRATAFQLNRLNVSEEDARSCAARAKNPGVKATWEGIASSVKARDAADAKRAEEAKKQRESGWNSPGKFNSRPPAASGGFTSPFSNPYAQPSYAEQSRRHEQYMAEMFRYTYGQQAWRPYKP